MRVLVAIVFYLVYWLYCFLDTGTDKKNLLGLRSYPDAVQQAVRNHPALGEKAPQEKSLFAILLGNLVLFTAVFSVLGLALKNVLGLHDFGTAFRFFLALGEGLVGLPRLLSPAVEKSDQALLTIALLGMAALTLLRLLGNHPLLNALRFAWMGIGCVWMFGGLLVQVTKRTRRTR